MRILRPVGLIRRSALALAAVFIGPLATQLVPAGWAGTDAALHAQTSLVDTSDRLASAWASGRFAEFDAFLPDRGVHLSLQGTDHRGVNRRQARAAIERFVEGFETERIAVRRAESLGGEPTQALVELDWTARAVGTPEQRSFVIFLSLERSSDEWSIREIRVFS